MRRLRLRGGEGIERDLEVLEDVMVSLITGRRAFPPPGELKAGDVLRICTPGGGGYGG